MEAVKDVAMSNGNAEKAEQKTQNMISEGNAEKAEQKTQNMISEGNAEKAEQKTQNMISEGNAEKAEQKTQNMISEGNAEKAEQKTQNMISEGNAEKAEQKTQNMISEGNAEKAEQKTQNMISEGNAEKAEQKTQNMISEGNAEMAEQKTQNLIFEDSEEEEEEIEISFDDDRDEDYDPMPELMDANTKRVVMNLIRSKKTYQRPAAPKASGVPVGNKTARALPEPSKERKKNQCPLCTKKVWNVSKHLRSSAHEQTRAESVKWRYSQHPTAMKQKPCSVAGCAIQTTNLGQHLVKFHHVDKETGKYAELMKDSSKRMRTTYSKYLTGLQQGTAVPEVGLPLEIVNKEIWIEYDSYLKQHEGKTIQARRIAVLHPIAALQTLNRHAHLRQIFAKPNDDTDTASYKLEEAFLLPLLHAARQNARTASNAVNKIRDLERFLQYLVERKSLYLQQRGIVQDEVQRMLSMLQNHWKKNKLAKLRHQRNVEQRVKFSEDPMDLQKLDLARLRDTLRSLKSRPYESRTAAVSLLIVTNFSRVGEIGNMSMKELSEAKEVAPGFFCIEVANHKTSGSMGSAPIILEGDDLDLLRTYAEGARKTICPLVTPELSVFTTSTGEKLTASHLNKIVSKALGGSASQIRKALAGRYMYEDPKFVKILSAKMQHTEATHSQWYEGVALRKDMLEVMQRINKDLCFQSAPSATATRPDTQAPPSSPAPESQAPPSSPAPAAEAPPSLPAPATEAPPSSPAPATEAPPSLPAPATEAPPSSPAPATEAPPSSPAPATEAPPSSPLASVAHHEEMDMTLLDSIPEAIRQWYKPEKAKLKKRDIPSGSRVKWTVSEHVALHKLFGAYRGTAVSISSCIRPVLECYPVSAKLLKARSISEIRDKIRGFAKKY